MLSNIPALDVQMLERPVAARQARVRVRERGLGAKHPVVIVPGFVSGIGVVARQRRRVVPAANVGDAGDGARVFSNQKCWMEHMRLDSRSGSDPEGIRLRAVRGLERVDWFVRDISSGRVIEELGELGYDANTIHSAAYDWRLSPTMLGAAMGISHD